MKMEKSAIMFANQIYSPIIVNSFTNANYFMLVGADHQNSYLSVS